LCDRFVEDIVSVTESLMVADAVELEAYAHPDGKLSLNDKVANANAGNNAHYGHARKAKHHHFKAALQQQQNGDGVFKRGTC
jgi:hypothetical protein